MMFGSGPFKNLLPGNYVFRRSGGYRRAKPWDANYHVVSDYLHAVPPSVVLELLDEIERLTCGLASWRERHEEALRPRGPTHKQERVE